jgi:hypothetical protein
MVDLEWKLVPPVAVSRPIPIATYAFELSWRDRSTNVHAQMWESSKKLIACNTCRKKNLSTGAAYDFRVRAVEELQGGMLGGRSEWSEVLNVTLKCASTANLGTPASGPAGTGSTYSYASASTASTASTSSIPRPANINTNVSGQNGNSKQPAQQANKQSNNRQGKANILRDNNSVDSVSDDSSIAEDDAGLGSDADEMAEEVEEEEGLYQKGQQAREVDPEQTPRSPARHAWKQRSPDTTARVDPASAASTARSTQSTATNNTDRSDGSKAKGANSKQQTAPATAAAATANNKEAKQATTAANTKASASTTSSSTSGPANSKHQSKTTAEAYMSESEVSSEEEEWRPNKAREKAKAKQNSGKDSNAKKRSKEKENRGKKRNSWSKKSADVWQQLFDDKGNAYYYNSTTGESKWEAPEWVEETDPESGARLVYSFM